MIEMVRRATGLVLAKGPAKPQNDIIAVVLGTVLYIVFMVWLHPLLIGAPVVPH